jgi:hypothetical protein
MGSDRSRNHLLFCAAISALLFPLLGAAILWLSGQDIRVSITEHTQHMITQCGVGLAVGTAVGFGAWALIALPFQRSVYNQYARLIQSLRLSWADIIFVSLCAGFGEEILFRWAVQPLLGVWVTAVLFVALHGYLSPKNWRLTIYGLYLVGVIAGLGYLCTALGVVSAAVAHTVIDVILLAVLAYTNKQPIFLR